jgi:hypothetical protein
MLGKLSLMQADTWWEVHAQLLVVCASLLSALSPAGAERQRATTLYVGGKRDGVGECMNGVCLVCMSTPIFSIYVFCLRALFSAS